ncbi:MAG: Flp pilus assembly complex ATPase component TadA [Candidatus Omnitrophica bacterium]|nr:Flp pilus assembly complex ATPase component TadA [Candidatus Omnitrophota bacterium]
MAASKPTKFGQGLVTSGVLTAEQLEQAMQEQASSRRFLGTILLERRWLSPEQLLRALSEQYGMPWTRFADGSVERQAIDAMPVKVATHYKVMPVRAGNGSLTVAIANPQDVRLADELQTALQDRFRIETVLATEEDIERAIKKHYGIGAETVSQLVKDQPASLRLQAVGEGAVEDIEQLADDASVVKLVNQLMVEAHHRRATDIHLEPYRGKVRLRYRIDGVLRNVDVPPAIRQLFPAILSRVKVLSNLNIMERRLPQDGRASVKVGEEKLDLRISVLPTPSGESIVVRILPNTMLLALKDLGFRAEDLDGLQRIIAQPHGLLFVTGPTGSGKTTTLYGMLNTINTERRKIITIEDPVEYEMDGVTQVQIHPSIGLTFATGLRSMLRHDPDVMMVGEVRDYETAELAIRIALTGHLVFSTLHTNDSASSVTRLLDMGVDPYLIVSSVSCFMAQRLVRLLCPDCKVEIAPERKDFKRRFQAKGCEACGHAGYFGRTAIYELLVMAEPIKQLVLQRASSDAIWRKAIECGMRTMQQDGWEKVSQGLTTPEEVTRVTQEQEDEFLRVTKEET